MIFMWRKVAILTIFIASLNDRKNCAIHDIAYCTTKMFA